MTSLLILNQLLRSGAASMCSAQLLPQIHGSRAAKPADTAESRFVITQCDAECLCRLAIVQQLSNRVLAFARNQVMSQQITGNVSTLLSKRTSSVSIMCGVVYHGGRYKTTLHRRYNKTSVLGQLRSHSSCHFCYIIHVRSCSRDVTSGVSR